jgi:DNA-directed RNA polymerase II subunit RPB2
MKPLGETRILNMLKMNNLSSGNQVIVAIMTHGGFNQEDSILFNQASVDRGLFHSTIYHTEKDEDKKVNGEEEIRTKPNKAITKNIKFGNYDKLNQQGIIPENTLIEDKDIIMGKIIAIKGHKNDNNKMIKYDDCSRSYKTNEECYVDKNCVDRNGDGYPFSKVKIRAYRVPKVGNKFSSRHGQKGTIGQIIREEDMPFTKDGLRPDLIINPHAIPSRMTIAQLKETQLGKVLLELGLYGDGTSFGDLSIKTICKQLQKANFESNGNEILYDGKSGEQISSSIFIGPVFYQCLKHMVADKQHSRCIGPMVNLTRQPAEGRSRDGGLRFGEMERDCMISHGASRFTQDRIYDCSDKYSVHVCNQCGLIVPYNEEEKIHYCGVCENRVDFSYVKIPYSCKLLFHELISMNVIPRMITN